MSPSNLPSHPKPQPQPPQASYTTPLIDHAYSPLSPLNTLTVHLPATTPLHPSYTFLYIHGGAFRDPLQTSASILPSLPHLFAHSPSRSFSSSSSSSPSSSHHLAAIISVNYRLAPYPDHPTDPSYGSAQNENGDGNNNDDNANNGENNKSAAKSTKRKEKPGRNARWPDPLDDIQAAVTYLGSVEFERAVKDAVAGTAAGGNDSSSSIAATTTTTTGTQPAEPNIGLRDGREWILAGHSVGATLAMMVAITPTATARDDDDDNEEEEESRGGAGLLREAQPAGTETPIETETQTHPKAETEKEKPKPKQSGSRAEKPKPKSSSAAAIDPATTTTSSHLRGLLCLEGIYDFRALLTHHWTQREAYEAWIQAALGTEEQLWERASVLRIMKLGKGKIRSGVRKVVVAHSRGDEAVEWEQSEELVDVLREMEEEEKKEEEKKKEKKGKEVEGVEGWRCSSELIEVKGGHDQVVEEGVEIARCVRVLVERLIG